MVMSSKSWKSGRAALMATAAALTVFGARTAVAGDTIVTYNFTPVAWDSPNAPYKPDGGTLSGNLVFDWTTLTVVSSSFTSTASTDGLFPAAVFSNMSTYAGGPWTYGPTGQVYEQIVGDAGQPSGPTGTLFVDFTQSDTQNFFPGDLILIHTSQDGSNGSRVLASTVAASLTPIDTNAPYYLASNLDVSVTADFKGGVLRADTATIADNFQVEAYSTNTIDSNGLAVTFTGVFQGSGGLTFEDTVGGGSTTFTNVSTYTGPTIVNKGATLLLKGAGSIASSGDPTVNGTFDISGTTSGASIVSLSGTGNVLLGSKTLTLTGASDTFSGVIADGGASGGTGGGLTIAGGTETLSGQNTYTGATTINSGAALALAGGGSVSTSSGVAANGTFDISQTTSGAAIHNLTGSGAVALGSQTLTLNNSGPASTFSGVIADGGLAGGGGGSLKVATGTEVLTGTNTFTGATTINSGATLQLGNGGGTGTVNSASIVDNGGLVVKQGANWTYGGVISGTGGVTVAGTTGVFGVTGANTYTGVTTINAGAWMQVGNATATGSIVSNVVDNGAFSFNRSNAYTYAGVISGTGVVDQGGAGVTTLTGANTYTGGTNIFGGALQIGNGTTVGSIVGNVLVFSSGATLVFDHSDTVTFAGVISGPGKLSQIGTGTLILNGVNTLSGLTTVSAGVLQIGDSTHTTAALNAATGGVTVGAAGTLAGYGAITGAVTNTAGGVVNPGAVGAIGTLTTGAYTQGSTSALTIGVSPTTASLLSSTGAVSLNGVLNVNYATGPYKGGAIYQIVASGTNAVSGTFSTVNQTGLPTGLVTGVYYKPDHSQVDLVVAQTSGAQAFGGVSSATLDQAQGLGALVEDQLSDGGCDGPNVSTSQAARTDRAGCQGMSAWAQTLASTDQIRGGGYAKVDSASTGFLGGLDHRWADGATLGVAFGYANDTLKMGDISAKGKGAAYFVSVYGRKSWGALQVDAQTYYLNNDWTVNRGLGAFGTASSSPKTTTFGGLVQVSAPFDAKGYVRPYARLSVADTRRDATSETGAGPLGFAVNSETSTSTRGELGVRFARLFGEGADHQTEPSLRIGVQQDFSLTRPTATAALEGVSNSSAFSVNATKPAATAGVVDGQLKVKLGKNFDLFGDARGRFSSNQTELAATIGGAYRF